MGEVHVEEVSKKRVVRARERRTDDRCSNRRSSRCPRCRLPSWTDRWGPFHPCLRVQAQSSDWSMYPVTSPHREHYVNLKHAELRIQSVDRCSPYRAVLTLKPGGLPTRNGSSISLIEFIVTSPRLLTLSILLLKGKWF